MAEKKPTRGTKKAARPARAARATPFPAPSPDLLSKCLSVADVILVALDREGRITLANRKACEILGWAEGDLIGLDWFETCVPVAGRARVRRVFEALVRGKLAPAEHFENTVLTKSGHTRTVAWHNTLLTGADGTVEGTLSSGRDITENREREAKIRLLGQVAEQVGDGVAVADPGGVLLWVNRAWAEMHGCTAEELVGRHLSTSHTPEQLANDVLPFNRAVLEQGSYRGEVGHVRKDGTVFPTEMITTLLRDDEGKVLGFLGTAKDITKRKRAEAALISAQDRLGDIVASNPAVIYSGFLIQDGFRTTFVSENFRELFGRDPSELTGNTRAWRTLIHPEDLPGVLETARKPFGGEPRRLVYRFLHGDGTYRWVANRMRPRRTGAEDPWEIVGNLIDIHELKEAQDGLRLSEARYRVLVENIQDGVFVIRNEVFQYVNEPFAAFVGFTPEELVGRRFTDFVAPEDLPLVYDRYRRRQAGEAVPSEYEFHTLHRDGKTRTLIHMNVGVVQTPEGAASIGTAKDVTKRKAMEDALRASEANFRLLAESTPIGILIYQDHRFVYANGAAESISGFSPEEILSLDMYKAVHPDDLGWFRSMNEARRRGQDAPRRYEFRILSKSGKTVWLDVSLGLTQFQGRPAYLASCLDITERRAAENALKTSEMRHRTLVAALPDLIFIVGEDGVFLDYHAASPSQILRPPEEFIGRSLEDVLGAELAGKTRNAMREVQATGATGILEYELPLRGETCYFEARIVLQPDGIYLIIVRDTTGRHAALEALRESEAKYRQIFEGVSEGIYLSTADGCPVMANPALARILGFENVEELSRRDIAAEGYADPEERTRFAEAILRDGRVTDWESRWLRKDGSVATVLINARGIPAPDGTIALYEGVVRDITERKQAEKALRESEAKYRLILETVREIIYFVSASEDDPFGTVTFVSPQVEEIVGYSPGEILSNPETFRVILHPKDRAAVLESYRTLLSGRGPESREYRVQDRRTGEYRWVEDLGVPVRDGAGTVVGFQGVVRDVSDRKRADELIRRKNLQLMALVDSSEVLGAMDFPRSARIICETARSAFKARLVWIGLVEPETTEILPVAESGDTGGYVRSARVRWDESPRSRGPTGLCIKRRMPVTMSVHDEAFTPWRGEALRHGFQYTCAVPLLHEDTVRGAINFYTDDPAGFPPDALEIMELFARHTVLALVSADLYQEARSSIEELLRKEEDLQMKTAHFEELFQSSPEAIAILDPQDRILDVNRQFATLFGWTKDEVEGRTINEVVVPSDQAEEATTISQRTLGGEIVESEGVRRRKDGSVFVASILGAPIHIGMKNMGVLAIYRDISAWKKAEEDLSASERKYRGLVENARAIVLTWRPDGVITYWNDFAAEYFGFSREEVLGRSLFDTIVPRVEDTGRDLERLLLDVGRDPDRFASNINQNTTKDGRTVWVAWANRPVMAPDGTINSVVSYGTDITSMKEAETSLRRSERRYRTLAEAAQDLIFLIGRDRTVLYVNDRGAAAFGVPAEKLAGMAQAELFPPPAGPALAESLDGVFETGQPLYRERRIPFPSGDRWLGTWLAPVPDGAGGVEGVLGISRDITERMAAEEALLKSEMRLRAIVENIPICVMVLDGEGRILDMNRAGLDLLKMESAAAREGMTCFDVLAPEDREVYRATLQAAFSEERATRVEAHLLTRDRRRLGVSTSIVPILDAAGRTLCLAISLSVPDP